MKKKTTYEKSFQHDDGRIYEFREIRIDVMEHPLFQKRRMGNIK